MRALITAREKLASLATAVQKYPVFGLCRGDRRRARPLRLAKPSTSCLRYSVCRLIKIAETGESEKI